MSNIEIKGLIQNNIKNINLSIPKHKIVIFTGVSGSGKSSFNFFNLLVLIIREAKKSSQIKIRKGLI